MHWCHSSLIVVVEKQMLTYKQMATEIQEVQIVMNKMTA